LSVLNPNRFTTDTATLGSIFTLSPRMSNDFRANWSRNGLHNSATLDNFGGTVPPPDSILFPPYAPRGDSVFQLDLGGVPFTTGAIAKNFQRQLNLVDGFSLLAGAHQLKFGIDYRRLYPIYNLFRYGISYSTGGIANAVVGRSAQTSFTFSDGPFYPVFLNFSAYAQDTWKVTPRLTLTYGLRWELSPPPKEARGRAPYTVKGVENPATMTLAPRGAPLYETAYRNFAPRVGLAYQLFQRSGWSTALRGGFGVFYDLSSGNAAGGIGGYPFVVRASLQDTPLPIAYAMLTSPALKPDPFAPPYDGVLLAFDPDFKPPRTYQMNVALEQSFGAHQTLSVSYVGAIGRNLLLRDRLFEVNPNFPQSLLV
jgi:outer membrane receptor protein involved in Fe transport